MLSVLAVIALGASQEPPTLDVLIDTNPDIAEADALSDAARADFRAARSEAFPQLRIEGEWSQLEETITVDGDPAGASDQERTPIAGLAALEQALFTSGRLSGTIGAARARADGADADAQSVRQAVLLDGATVMANVVRDREIAAAQRRNEAAIAARLEEATARRSAGRATVTDVRQAEARLAGATAARIGADAQVIQSEAAYRRVFGGTAPTQLVLPIAPQNLLPASLDDALRLAEQQNPSLLAATNRATAATLDVRAARAAGLPQVFVSAEAAYTDEEQFGQALGEAEQYGVFVRARMDLFSSGGNRARVKSAAARATAAERATLSTERRVREDVVAAWSARDAAIASREALSAAVTAAQAARDGTVREAEVGRRTRLDVLDAEQELLDAEVDLLSARRDVVVAEFALLRAVGGL